MTKIAIIKTGGKQYKVKEGQTLKVEKLDEKEGAKITFDTLLVAASDGTKLNIGKPELGKLVEGKVIEEGQGDKVAVVKFHNKTRHLRTRGHRQTYTKIEIAKIS